MKNISIALVAFAFLAGIFSCKKDKLDSPPAGGTDPNITVNYSIKALKNLYVGAGFQITTDRYISAVVVGDDRSGNLYKQLAIEDSTAGIMLMIASSGLYNTYPIGKRLFINLNGLWFGQKKGLYQLGAYLNADGSVGGIALSNASNNIFPGKWGINVPPIVTTIANVNAHYNDLQSELIELDNVEFAAGNQGIAYATGYGITLQDCSSNFVTVYTSPGYATFCNSLSPTGNGKFICLVGAYNGPQLTIRDTTDIFLTGPTCSQQHNNTLSIAQLRALYTGSTVTLPNNTSISGIVISDGSQGNIANTDMYVQDATGGMLIHFNAPHSFALGANLTLNISGQLLISANGGLQISALPVANATQNGTGTVTPRTATIAQVNQNASAWESTLIQLSGVTINSGTAGTYSGSHSVNDGSGTAALLTLSSASFAATSYPTTPVGITCILGQNNGVQLEIRNTGDVH